MQIAYLALVFSLLFPETFGQAQKVYRLHSQRSQGLSKKHRGRATQDKRSSQLTRLSSDLRAQGATVKSIGTASQPFFSVKGQELSVSRESVQVFVYANAAAAEVEAKQVSPTGTSVGTSMASWIATPHFYRKGNLIVLYVGGNGVVTKALEAVLGPQFAGG